MEATQRHQEVLWRKVRGYSKTGRSHKSGNDRADELALAAKKEAYGDRSNGSRPLEEQEAPKLAAEAPQR